MKVAVLWTKLSGYLNSCLRALAEIEDVELFVAYQAATSDAPFADEQFKWFSNYYRYETTPATSELLPRLHSFKPDVMLVSSWHIAGYRAVCGEFRNRAVRVCCMDNQWEGTLKQWLGIATSPLYVQRLFDAAFVAGERQSTFARKLGFGQDRVWRGIYSCDHPAFSAAYKDRKTIASLPDSFLYVGRLSPEKGIDVLLDAYRLYQSRCPVPWSLIVAGEGPLRGDLEKVSGVKTIGFVQPDQLPLTFSQAGCLVLPSRWEPWGLVIHEACAAGLPVICTNACGAAVHLVQDGYNGFIAETGDPHSLARAFRRFTDLSTERRKAMGDASHLLSLQFTPERWATCVYDRGSEMMNTSARAKDRL